MNENENKFKYTYSAPTERERQEIDDIRKRYLPEEKQLGKLDLLKALDAKAKSVPKIFGYTLGVFGILVFGLGLTMVLEWRLFAAGSIVAAIGGIAAGLAYPVYRKVSKKSKEKYGKEILRLSEELLGEKEQGA